MMSIFSVEITRHMNVTANALAHYSTSPNRLRRNTNNDKGPLDLKYC